MASAKARAIAKAQAFNREQEIRKIWLMTIACAVTLVVAGLLSVL